MKEIPIYQNVSSNFEQEITLGDRLVTIVITWNSRSEAFYLNITDEGNEIKGIKIIPNWLLLKQYKYLLPDFEGDLLVIEEDPNVEDRITYDNLGVGWKLYWVDESEVNTWEEENNIG